MFLTACVRVLDGKHWSSASLTRHLAQRFAFEEPRVVRTRSAEVRLLSLSLSFLRQLTSASRVVNRSWLRRRGPVALSPHKTVSRRVKKQQHTPPPISFHPPISLCPSIPSPGPRWRPSSSTAPDIIKHNTTTLSDGVTLLSLSLASTGTPAQSPNHSLFPRKKTWRYVAGGVRCFFFFFSPVVVCSPHPPLSYNMINFSTPAGGSFFLLCSAGRRRRHFLNHSLVAHSILITSIEQHTHNSTHATHALTSFISFPPTPRVMLASSSPPRSPGPTTKVRFSQVFIS